MNNTELWKPVVGWEGLYEVSSLGNVRNKSGRRLLGACLNGYRHVHFRCPGRSERHLIHRIVMRAFVGRPDEGIQVNHLNGIKNDNRLDNLEYVTHAQNILHAFRVLGRAPNITQGAQNGRAKLTDSDVRDIRSRYARGGVTQTELANEYRVNQTMVGFIVRRAHWKHVS